MSPSSAGLGSRTRAPRRGSRSTQPSCVSRASASRTAIALMPSSCATGRLDDARARREAAVADGVAQVRGRLSGDPLFRRSGGPSFIDDISKRAAGKPGLAARVERSTSARQLGHVALDVVAVPAGCRPGADSPGQPERLRIEFRRPAGRSGRCGPSRRSADARSAPSDRGGARRSRRSARCRRRRQRRHRPRARWEIVIFVCATARSPATSIGAPPRKCRILTPAVPALPADPDKFLGGALAPGRHHPAVVVPDGAEAVPVEGVAPDGPALDRGRG